MESRSSGTKPPTRAPVSSSRKPGASSPATGLEPQGGKLARSRSANVSALASEDAVEIDDIADLLARERTKNQSLSDELHALRGKYEKILSDYEAALSTKQDALDKLVCLGSAS